MKTAKSIKKLVKELKSELESKRITVKNLKGTKNKYLKEQCENAQKRILELESFIDDLEQE